MTAPNPLSDLTAPQVAAFERVAVGMEPMAAQRTIAALLKRGMIQKIGMKRLGTDRFGPIEIPVYEVPIRLHMAWCAWCAENVEEPPR